MIANKTIVPIALTFVGVLVAVLILNFVATPGQNTIIVHAPVNHSNLSSATNVMFNVSYVNGTDRLASAQNITAWTNFTGTWVVINWSTANYTACLSTLSAAPTGGVIACNGTFNVTNMADGYHTINITLSNDSQGQAGVAVDFMGSTVVTTGVRVDNRVPLEVNLTSTIGGERPVSGSNYSGVLNLNITAVDNNGSYNDTNNLAFGLTVVLNITNGNGVQNKTVTATRQNTTRHWFNASINTVGIVDGNYTIIAQVTDAAGNKNYTRKLTNIIIDNTAPGITNTRSSSSSKTQIVVDISVSDTVGINTTCGVDATGATITDNDATQTMTETGLSCGTTYEYVFTCYDEIRNRKVKTQSFATDSCTGGGDDGGGSGSGSDDVGGIAWSNTYAENDVALSEKEGKSVTKELDSKNRVKIKVGREDHHVGVLSVTTTTAVIQVSSDPEQVEFEVGDTRKFDVDDDERYDLSVTLDAIVNGKAKVTIVSIDEPVSDVEESLKSESAVEVTPEDEEEPEEEARNLLWLWILIGVIVVVVIVFFVMKSRK